MSKEDVTMFLAVGNFILTWGVALYMYLANKNKATNERIGKLEDDIDDKFEKYGQRLQHLETSAESAPNHADLAKVYDSVNKLAATVNQLVGENQGQSDTLRLILNQIMQKGMA